MRGFYQQRFNLLLCTTIIETGIDVPTANTILMHRADKFGLAQLHQLRGRVGRSHHQAYAYLLVHSEEALTPQAKKRLEAIQMMEDLGSGFYLAMHDLEIRGAGEVLGESQSGEMQEIGFSLYTEMLAHAVACLKVGKEPDLSEPLGITTEINLHAPALLPEDYCGDIHERLTLYKRLANCKTLDELNYLFEELVDRFGKLPEAAQVLVESHRLRVTAQQAGVLKIDAGPETITIQFKKDAPIDPARVIKLVQKNRNVQLSGQDRLKIVAKTQTPVERAHHPADPADRVQGAGDPCRPARPARHPRVLPEWQWQFLGGTVGQDLLDRRGHRHDRATRLRQGTRRAAQDVRPGSLSRQGARRRSAFAWRIARLGGAARNA
jgi:transcription-repair coupling factor (superfamily II helicase)